jgi:hypothetical protein
MIKILTLALAVFTGGSVMAQPNPDEQLVKDVIVQLFKNMELADTAKMRSAFANEVSMATVTRDKNGSTVVQRENAIDGWLKAIGTPRKDILFEEIWNVKVQLDGDFAQAWCDYAFYRGNTFSHCGVDAFQLYKGKDGWKIFHVADTRRKDNCTIPQQIQDKHKVK